MAEIARMTVTSATRYRFSRFELDLVRGCLRDGERDIKLRPKAFATLRLLVEQAGRLISKDELMAVVWPGVFVSDDSLVHCIREIRRALDDAEQTCIQNVPGRGYLFALPVTEAVPGPPPSPRAARAGRRRRLGWAVAAALGTVAVLGAAAMRLIEASPSAGAPSLTAVAVLPFERVGDLDEGVAMAFSDDLRAALVHRASGTVAARQASLRQPRAADPTRVGRTLDVRFVVAGTVWRDAGLVRVAVKLDDALTGTQAWGQTFGSDAAELASDWDDLVTRVDVELERVLTLAAAERSWREHRDDPTARDFEIRGHELIRKLWNRDAYLAAREQYEQALHLDPDSFEATVRLAELGADAVLGNWVGDPAGELARADALDRAALAKRPNSALAHFVRGALLRAHGDYEQAITAYERTLELNPRMIWARAGIGRALVDLGRFEDALGPLRTVLRISPGDPSASRWLYFAGISELLLGQDEAAVLSLRKSIEMDPDAVYHRRWLIAACGLTGRRTEAERELALVRARIPSFSAERLIAALPRMGVPADGDQIAHLREGFRRAGVLD